MINCCKHATGHNQANIRCDVEWISVGGGIDVLTLFIGFKHAGGWVT